MDLSKECILIKICKQTKTVFSYKKNISDNLEGNTWNLKKLS